MIITFSDLERVRSEHQDKKIVFASGVFDILHEGHIAYLKHLKSLGDILVGALSTDKSVRDRKGPDRPINLETVRTILMDAIRYVDYAFVSPEATEMEKYPTTRILESLRPDIFGFINPTWLERSQDLAKIGVKPVFVEIDKVNSTTQIIEKIRRQA